MTPQQYARAKELFASAARLSIGQRDTFFEQHADEAPEVLDEVRSLLKHHSQQTLLARTDDTQLHLDSLLHSKSTRSRDQDSLATAGFLLKLSPRGYLAVGIVLTCLLLGVVNYLTHLATQSTLRELRGSILSNGLDATVAALELWIDQEKTKVRMVARDPDLRRQVEQLIELADGNDSAKVLATSNLQSGIRVQIEADLGATVRYAIWDRRFLTIADGSPDGTGVGSGVTPYGAALLAKAFDGETLIQLPGDHESIIKDDPLTDRAPSIGVIAPIRSRKGEPIAAVLVYGMGAEVRFNEILSLIQFGETGETYAFDKTGLMLSNSRFQQQLLKIGLTDGGDTPSNPRVFLRDPGGDLTRGYVPTTPPKTWPLTTMARFATAGKDDVNFRGYRDYRGVTVVGAWRWLDAYEFGVATELDLVELNMAMRFLRLQSAFKFFLLATALAGALFSYYSLARLRRQVGTDSRVGQYTLEEKIGEGGMGVVYKARHALLKRPTALKLLKTDVTNARTVAWFEREVQLASRLTHPNTIAIYDYGVTPEGLFYYVMEYLDGKNLVQVIEQDGPLPPDRAVRILRQVGGSLREAHHIGLVHRDIKPHNIMLCQRACESDVVKVLDFGLVKEMQGDDQHASTVLAGTPQYMAPERISSPGHNDPRVDLYALGAVGFYLLTGREIFADTNDSRGILHHVINTIPPRVSQCTDTPIPEALVDLIESCLAKDPEKRPADIDTLLAVLDQLQSVPT